MMITKTIKTVSKVSLHNDNDDNNDNDNDNGNLGMDTLRSDFSRLLFLHCKKEKEGQSLLKWLSTK